MHHRGGQLEVDAGAEAVVAVQRVGGVARHVGGRGVAEAGVPD